MVTGVENRDRALLWPLTLSSCGRGMWKACKCIASCSLTRCSVLGLLPQPPQQLLHFSLHLVTYLLSGLTAPRPYRSPLLLFMNEISSNSVSFYLTAPGSCYIRRLHPSPRKEISPISMLSYPGPYPPFQNQVTPPVERSVAFDPSIPELHTILSHVKFKTTLNWLIRSLKSGAFPNTIAFCVGRESIGLTVELYQHTWYQAGVRVLGLCHGRQTEPLFLLHPTVSRPPPDSRVRNEG
ncbi:hypothetical protein H6P81_007465 [Aristolochia fimbriata]|uniref:Uncharacterized protein n=1 Tax=Aristolochia fimbriata TaxID=158543 RepID=A0AAV7F3Z2_ARIFI|nr:hypothetical protein H6P81_007465 [Aristolochia fimbriata]